MWNEKKHTIFFKRWEKRKKLNKIKIEDCNRRRLEETYIVVYAIKNEITIKKGEMIDKTNIYTLIGIDIKGYRQFLNIYQDRDSGWIVLKVWKVDE